MYVNNISRDEEILYGCYKELEKIAEKKTKEVDPEGDKQLISGIASSTSLMLMRLTDKSIRLTMTELQKYLIKAKGLVYQYYLIKGRNPGYIYPSLSESMNKLVHAVAHHEAEMLSTLRGQEKNGDKIDIQSILKPRIVQLSSVLARDLIRDSINRGNKPFIKEDDKKNYVTAFVDEAVRPIEWDNNGFKGKTGSFSYIICSGYLDSEKQISTSKRIGSGVEYINETVHIELITANAIGKVLMDLAYDHDFKGNVLIYTDNMVASNKWDQIPKNVKLARLFKSVKVIYIPREENKEADKLGRTRVHLDIPTVVYEQTIKKAGRVRELEAKVQLMEANMKMRDKLRGLGFFKRLFGLNKKNPVGIGDYIEPLTGTDDRSVA